MFTQLSQYPVKSTTAAQRKKFMWPSPVLTIEFADGETVRAPAVSIEGKPVNVLRGVDVALAYYRARKYRQIGQPDCARDLEMMRAIDVPVITACRCEATGEEYSPADLMLATFHARAGIGSERQAMRARLSLFSRPLALPSPEMVAAAA